MGAEGKNSFAYPRSKSRERSNWEPDPGFALARATGTRPVFGKPARFVPKIRVASSPGRGRGDKLSRSRPDGGARRRGLPARELRRQAHQVAVAAGRVAQVEPLNHHDPAAEQGAVRERLR